MLHDSAKLKGFLKIQVFDAKTGEELRAIEKPNLVCVGALEAMERLMALRGAPHNDDADDERIFSIHVGDSDVTPVTSQTDLQGASTFKKAVTQPISIDVEGTTGFIQCTMTLESGEANGITIRECGLFSKGTDAGGMGAGVRMYARQVHGTIEKTSQIRVAYKWNYQVTS